MKLISIVRNHKISQGFSFFSNRWKDECMRETVLWCVSFHVVPLWVLVLCIIPNDCSALSHSVVFLKAFTFSLFVLKVTLCKTQCCIFCTSTSCIKIFLILLWKLKQLCSRGEALGLFQVFPTSKMNFCFFFCLNRWGSCLLPLKVFQGGNSCTLLLW